MAAKPTMLPLGAAAPEFSLPDTVGGAEIAIGDLPGKALVVIFLCNHCPYVKHVQAGLVAFSRDYADKDVSIVGIGSNDAVGYPDDAPERLGAVARELGYNFPVLYDESQAVAKAYTAACTPDFFIFGPDRTLVYRGRFDESRPNSDIPVTGADLRAAVDAVLAGGPVADPQFPAIGCSIKWRPGNEPG